MSGMANTLLEGVNGVVKVTFGDTRRAGQCGLFIARILSDKKLPYRRSSQIASKGAGKLML